MVTANIIALTISARHDTNERKSKYYFNCQAIHLASLVLKLVELRYSTGFSQEKHKDVAATRYTRHTISHSGYYLFIHANALALPMGLLGRVFPPVPVEPFSLTDAVVEGIMLFASPVDAVRFRVSEGTPPSKLDLLLPSSKKRD